MVEQTILQPHQPARLGIVDATREHARQARHARGDAAEEIGAAAAVKVHEIGCLVPHQPVQAQRERDIRIAAHRQFEHLRGIAGRRRDVTAGRAGQQVVHAAGLQPFEDVEDLARATVQVAAGFDVQHLHRPSTCAASRSTASAEMSRRQVKAPLQVGRRRQGEHSSPSQMTRALSRPVSR